MVLQSDTKQVRVRLSAQDNFSNVLQQAGSKTKRTLNDIEREARQTDRAMDRLGAEPRGLRGFIRDLGVARTGIAAIGTAAAGMIAGTVVTQVTQLIGQVRELGGEVIRARNLFGTMTKDIGGQDRALEGMRKVTRGIVDDLTLMQTGSRLVGLGLADNQRDLQTLTEIGAVLGQAFGGVTAAQGIDNLAMAISNESIVRLDTFGISSAEVRVKIDELLASGEALNRSEAFKLAVMDIGARKVDQISGAVDKSVTAIDRMETAWQNFTQGFATAALTLLDTGLGGVFDFIDAFNQASVELTREQQARADAVRRSWEAAIPESARMQIDIGVSSGTIGVDIADAIKASMGSYASEMHQVTATAAEQLFERLASERRAISPGAQRFQSWDYDFETIAQLPSDLLDYGAMVRGERERYDQMVGLRDQYTRMPAELAASYMRITDDPFNARMPHHRMGLPMMPRRGQYGPTPDLQYRTQIRQRLGDAGYDFGANYLLPAQYDDQTAEIQSLGNKLLSLERGMHQILEAQSGGGGNFALANVDAMSALMQSMPGMMGGLVNAPFVTEGQVSDLESNLQSIEDWTAQVRTEMETQGLGTETFVAGLEDAAEQLRTSWEESSKKIVMAAEAPFQTLIGLSEPRQYSERMMTGLGDYMAGAFGDQANAGTFGQMMQETFGRGNDLTDYLRGEFASDMETAVALGMDIAVKDILWTAQEIITSRIGQGQSPNQVAGYMTQYHEQLFRDVLERADFEEQVRAGVETGAATWIQALRYGQEAGESRRIQQRIRENERRFNLARDPRYQVSPYVGREGAYGAADEARSQRDIQRFLDLYAADPRYQESPYLAREGAYDSAAVSRRQRDRIRGYTRQYELGRDPRYQESPYLAREGAYDAAATARDRRDLLRQAETAVDSPYVLKETVAVMNESFRETRRVTQEMNQEFTTTIETLGQITGATRGGVGQEFGGMVGGMIDDPERRADFMRSLGLLTGAETRTSVMLEDTLAPLLSTIASEMGPELAAQLSIQAAEAGRAARQAGGSDQDVTAAMRGAVPWVGGGQRQINVQPGWGRWSVEQQYGALTDAEYAQLTGPGGVLHPGQYTIGSGAGLRFTGAPPGMAGFGEGGVEIPGEDIQTGPMDAFYSVAQDINTEVDTLTEGLELISDMSIEPDFSGMLSGLEIIERKLEFIKGPHTVTVDIDENGGSSGPGGTPPLPRPRNTNDPRAGQQVSIDGFTLSS